MGMADKSPPVHRSPSAGDEPEPKKRKVRKGTQSCWECKRRKIRCTFAAPIDAICDGCKRRGTTCVSQEFPDEPAAAGSNRPVGDRLGRMEALVEQLVKKASIDTVPNDLPDLLPQNRQAVRGEPRSTTSYSPNPNAGISTPAPSDVEEPAYLSWLGHETGVCIFLLPFSHPVLF
jgi:hypothetical protein